MAMSLVVFVADAAATLVARIARGEAWHSPHRTHLYQRLVRSGLGHGAVAAALAGLALALTVAAAALFPGPLLRGAGWALVAAAVALVLAEGAIAGRRAAADAR
jgi:hypothetical protein